MPVDSVLPQHYTATRITLYPHFLPMCRCSSLTELSVNTNRVEAPPLCCLSSERIIRKTKRSEKTKRSVPPRKTKRSFSRPPITQNASDFSGAFSVYSSLHFRHSSRTSHSHRHQAATLCAPSYSRICVRFQGLTLCSSAAGLSAVP